MRPATAERWADLEKLFGARGACGGCWCMAWRLTRREWEQGKGESNKTKLRELTAGPVPPGILLYRYAEVVGWCSVARREEFSALARSRVLRPLDDRPVWSVSCLFVRKDMRRRGLASLLLKAAVDFAAAHGATVVEGYPIRPSGSAVPAPFIWTGTEVAFRRAGFEEAGRHSDARPIFRKRPK